MAYELFMYCYIQCFVLDFYNADHNPICSIRSWGDAWGKRANNELTNKPFRLLRTSLLSCLKKNIFKEKLFGDRIGRDGNGRDMMDNGIIIIPHLQFFMFPCIQL